MNDIFQITSLKCSILFRQMFWLTKRLISASLLVKLTDIIIPEHKYMGFSSSARVLLWPQVVTRLTSDPKESKVRVQRVLHGQIQVQADRQNWFHMPKYITQRYQYHWTACLQKPGWLFYQKGCTGTRGICLIKYFIEILISGNSPFCINNDIWSDLFFLIIKHHLYIFFKNYKVIHTYYLQKHY